MKYTANALNKNDMQDSNKLGCAKSTLKYASVNIAMTAHRPPMADNPNNSVCAYDLTEFILFTAKAAMTVMAMLIAISGCNDSC